VKKIKVLYVAHERDLNGGSLALLEMLDSLRLTCAPIVLMPHKDGGMYDALRARNIKVWYAPFHRWLTTAGRNKMRHFVRMWVYRAWGISDVLLSIPMARKAKKAGIDMIHTNTSVNPIGAWIGKWSNIPHIWHIREHGPKGLEMNFVYPEKMCYRFMEKHSQRLIFISRTLRDAYGNAFEDDKTQIIYDGVKTIGVENKGVRIPKAKFQLCIAGRLDTKKGQEDAIRAIAMLRQKGYTDIQLNIVGEGDKESYYKALADQLGVTDQTRFLGYRSDLNELRESMDVELVCSRFEGFGRITVEAMMMQMPVIGANSGATRELIQEKKNGLLYEAGDIEDLASCIETLYLDKTLCETLGKNGMKQSQLYTAEKNAEHIVTLYREIVSKQNEEK